jgi:CRP-like cAMP-binding protein
VYETTGNRLLDALPGADRRRLQAVGEVSSLRFGEALLSAQEPMLHVYFPVEGIVSLIMTIDGSSALEVGLVGNEGMVGVHVALGQEHAPLSAEVRGEGRALRVRGPDFLRELRRGSALRRRLERYAAVRLVQFAQAAGCTRYHVVEARLARWLSMMRDRSGSGALRVTQEHLASALGVRRVGVTKAAGSLRARGLIHYSRGGLTVFDRRGLREAACGCYRADLNAYRRILG